MVGNCLQRDDSSCSVRPPCNFSLLLLMHHIKQTIKNIITYVVSMQSYGSDYTHFHDQTLWLFPALKRYAGQKLFLPYLYSRISISGTLKIPQNSCPLSNRAIYGALIACKYGTMVPKISCHLWRCATYGGATYGDSTVPKYKITKHIYSVDNQSLFFFFSNAMKSYKDKNGFL